eukprot:scaffold746_cov123-Cylindrotheca_fusiformis.AAC.21
MEKIQNTLSFDVFCGARYCHQTRVPTMKSYFVLALLLSFLSSTFAFTHASVQFPKVSGGARLGKLSAGPAVLDRPETVEKVDEKVGKDDATERDPRNDSGGWEIRLFNDPFNKREFVARCLSTICGKSDSESYQIMMEAHSNGMGVVGRYMFEIAELYHGSLQENGLMVDMVPVEEE